MSLALAKHWIEIDPDQETRTQVEGLVNANNIAELDKLFLGHRIAFGTAGLRAKMMPGYKGLNQVVVRQTAQGLCRAVEANVDDAKTRGIVIGHDHRAKSRLFAETTAQVFLAKGFRVYLFNRITPTPYVAFAVSCLGAACGVMVTPSHNPKGDNGYKVYWSNGAQIIPPYDGIIQKAIEENLDFWKDVSSADPYTLGAIDCTEVVEAAYLTKARETCHFNSDAVNAATKVRAVFTPMHGVGKDATAKITKWFHLPPLVTVAEQIEPDPEFSTVVFPNPEEKGALDLAMKTADREGLSLVMAQDPDSDRFAAAEKQKDGHWHIFTGNELALLLSTWALKHVRKDRLKDGVMLSSTVSSKILKAVSQDENNGGFLFEETLTGFKWMGNRARELEKEGKFLIFAFEVEIGFVVNNMSVDKDGVRTLATFYELYIDLCSRNTTVYDHLDSLYKRYGYYETVNSYCRGRTTEAMNKVFDRLRKDGVYASSIAGFPVVSVRDLTTGYDSSKPDKKAVLYVDPTSQMITYYLEGGSTVTLRTSGTEPKLKYYVETCHKEREIAKNNLNAIVEKVINDLIVPNEDITVA